MAELSDRQRRNLEVTYDAFAAFRPDALEGALTFISPEVEVFSSEDLANPGRFHGHEGYVTWVSQWLDAWEDYKLDPHAVKAVGEHHVVIDARQAATGKGSGVPVEMDVAFMVEVEDDLAVAFHLYPSVDEAVDVARSREDS